MSCFDRGGLGSDSCWIKSASNCRLASQKLSWHQPHARMWFDGAIFDFVSPACGCTVGGFDFVSVLCLFSRLRWNDRKFAEQSRLMSEEQHTSRTGRLAKWREVALDLSRERQLKVVLPDTLQCLGIPATIALTISGGATSSCISPERAQWWDSSCPSGAV